MAFNVVTSLTLVYAFSSIISYKPTTDVIKYDKANCHEYSTNTKFLLNYVHLEIWQKSGYQM